ncbi:MAG: hypothetical protein WDO16_10345 [Bacteroidota bacterium]
MKPEKDTTSATTIKAPVVALLIFSAKEIPEPAGNSNIGKDTPRCKRPKKGMKEKEVIIFCITAHAAAEPLYVSG